MIQRIQSIFLLLASASCFSLFLDPMNFFEVDNPTTLDTAQQTMLADGIFDIQDHVIILGMVVLAGAIALISIFLFSNRKLQMTLTRLFLVLTILTVFVVSIFFYQDFQLLATGTEVEVGFGILAPIAAIIFAALAIRFIKKDDTLVQSMDRLR